MHNILFEFPSETGLDRARALVMKYGWNSTAYQILNKGIKLWFSESSEAVIGYQEYGQYRIVAGGPVCSHEDLKKVVEEFEVHSRIQQKQICYFCAGARLASLLSRDNSKNYILLGAEPVWNPKTWKSIVLSKPSLRAQLARAINKGVTVSRWETEKAAAHPLVKKCLDDWLLMRGLPPLHFLIESQTLDRLLDRRIYVAERDGIPIGFVVVSPIPNRNGWLVEQNIRGDSAPNGTIELLLSFAAEDVALSGSDFFTLGLSPLSLQISNPSTHSLWLTGVLLWLRAHGKRFYNFEGLDTFKSKFQPDYWEPIYAITSEEKINIRTLYAVAGAFAGMSPIKLLFIALLRALQMETHVRK